MYTDFINSIFKAHVHDCKSNHWTAEVCLWLWWETMASSLFKGTALISKCLLVFPGIKSSQTTSLQWFNCCQIPQDILWPFNPPSNRDKRQRARSLWKLILRISYCDQFRAPWSEAGTNQNMCTMKCQISPLVFCRTALIRRISRICTRNMSNDISWVSHFSRCLMQHTFTLSLFR